MKSEGSPTSRHPRFLPFTFRSPSAITQNILIWYNYIDLSDYCDSQCTDPPVPLQCVCLCRCVCAGVCVCLCRCVCVCVCARSFHVLSSRTRHWNNYCLQRHHWNVWDRSIYLLIAGLYTCQPHGVTSGLLTSLNTTQFNSATQVIAIPIWAEQCRPTQQLQRQVDILKNSLRYFPSVCTLTH